MKTHRRYLAVLEQTPEIEEEPAQCSHYITHLDSLKPGPVVLYLRVSDRAQKKHLKGQKKNLFGYLTKRGFAVVAIFKEIVSGCAEKRACLERTALKAIDAGAVLVAESGCRFLRAKKFYRDSNGKERLDQKGIPTVAEMERLKRLTRGAQLATLLHPDEQFHNVRSHQSKRGQSGSGNSGEKGRRAPGWTKKRRELIMAEVLELREEGMSFRKIGNWVSVHWSTARDWIQREKC